MYKVTLSLLLQSRVPLLWWPLTSVVTRQSLPPLREQLRRKPSRSLRRVLFRDSFLQRGTLKANVGTTLLLQQRPLSPSRLRLELTLRWHLPRLSGEHQATPSRLRASLASSTFVLELL